MGILAFLCLLHIYCQTLHCGAIPPKDGTAMVHLLAKQASFQRKWGGYPPKHPKHWSHCMGGNLPKMELGKPWVNGSTANYLFSYHGGFSVINGLCLTVLRRDSSVTFSHNPSSETPGSSRRPISSSNPSSPITQSPTSHQAPTKGHQASHLHCWYPAHGMVDGYLQTNKMTTPCFQKSNVFPR